MTNNKNLGDLPHWDVSTIYPSLESDELKRDVAGVKSDIANLTEFMDEMRMRKGEPVNPDLVQAALDGYLARANALIRRYYTIGAYIRTFVTTDSFNETARRLLSEFEPTGVTLDQMDKRFGAWVGTLGDALVTAIARGGAAQDHAFYLRETVRQSQYLMSEAEENLASELSLSGANAWSKLQGTVTSQLTVSFDRNVNGNVNGNGNGMSEKLPIPALINVMQHDPDAAVRKRAYEAEHAAWETVKEPLAAAMNGVKGTTNTLNKRRGRNAAIDSALDQTRIDRATLDAMLSAMQDSFPTFRTYLRKKAQRLGHTEGLPWWDLMAPVGQNERSYTWSEARAFVLEHFATFSERLVNMTQRAFDQNWIDAEQRPGKRGGAFCMKIPGIDESRILCNFDGSLDQVSTIAHELGHAFHNECQVGVPMLRAITPMTLAETASIFCETLIVDAALGNATSSDEKLSILETDLIGKTQVIVDITSRYLFETEVFKRREKAELSADELCELMLNCQRQTYGDGLDARYLHKFMWTWKPHYYYAGLSFYNFPYAFGLLFATGLYAIYKQEGKAFVPRYERLLAQTGEGNAADLAAQFDIDIHNKVFWQHSLDVVGERIAQYCAL
jgi:pepF/M3 family oligoendopeptidase